jgi:hypothetical protein
MRKLVQEEENGFLAVVVSLPFPLGARLGFRYFVIAIMHITIHAFISQN